MGGRFEDIASSQLIYRRGDVFFRGIGIVLYREQIMGVLRRISMSDR
jgi:hypothetical protein